MLLPDGQPAPGAHVALHGSDFLWLSNSTLQFREAFWDTPRLVVADQQGRFSLPPGGGVGVIVAASEAGYAEIVPPEFTNGSAITLQPWGRIEGVRRIGALPATNRQVHLTPYNNLFPVKRAFENSTTDHDGKFVFTYVPPGVWRLDDSDFEMGSGNWFRVKPGETNHVIVGGAGRPVTGKLLMDPSKFANTDNAPPIFVYLYLLSGHQALDGQSKDGTFRVDDVPAGTWHFIAEVHHGEFSAVAGRMVVVPEMPGGRSDEPLDLGTVELGNVHPLAVGETAPLFDVKTTDDKAFSLAAHRGQYVLLDFEGNHDTNRETHSLLAAYPTFATNNRLALLTLWVPPDDPGLMSAHYDFSDSVSWPQAELALLPYQERDLLLYSYGLPPAGTPRNSSLHDTNLPAVFIIGPDGKIAARNLHGNAIKAAVAKALAANPVNSNTNRGTNTVSRGRSTPPETPPLLPRQSYAASAINDIGIMPNGHPAAIERGDINIPDGSGLSVWTIGATGRAAVCNFDTYRTEAIHGTVLLPNGQPAAGAQVALHVMYDTLSLRNGWLYYGNLRRVEAEAHARLASDRLHPDLLDQSGDIFPEALPTCSSPPTRTAASTCLRPGTRW